jgi:hypothetical protein
MTIRMKLIFTFYSKMNLQLYLFKFVNILLHRNPCRGRCGRDRMVVGFSTTCTITTYHHISCGFESRPWQCVLHTTFSD